MLISFIVAVDQNMGMGKDNALPWHLPADFKMFKETTKGHCILMGRKTFESLKSPLPFRTNIVLSSQQNFYAEGIVVKNSIASGISYAEQLGENELFIIGGAEIFTQAFPLAGKLYLTKVEGIFEADTFFPKFDLSAWDCIKNESHSADEKNKFDFSFLQYLRK